MAEGLNIRDYLLGILDDPEHLDALEKRYLTDDDFAARVAGEMDELYEQYLDGDLSDLQRNAFETHFLVNEDRRHQLEVIRALRAAGRSTPGVQTASGGEADKRSLLGMLFANPFVRYGFAVVLIAVIGIGFWRFAIYRSNIDLGLAQLREAYAGERPVESRITDLSYSPFRTTRGVGDDKEKAARDRAEKLLTLAAGESDDARSQAALGKFYLTQRKFEQANELFAKAAAAAPNDARIHADWGASLLELARIKVSAGEKAEGPRDGRLVVDHCDLYRLNGPVDLAAEGLEDVVVDPGNVLCVEWPERLAGAPAGHAATLTFEFLGEEARRITVRARPEAADRLAAAFA